MTGAVPFDCVTVGASFGDFDDDTDVDQDDFGRFELCMTGPALGPPPAGCENMDMDADGDVDVADFGRLQRCFSGPSALPDAACR